MRQKDVKKKNALKLYFEENPLVLAISLMIISTFIAALAQVFFKLATLSNPQSLILPFFSYYFFMSVFLTVLNLFVFTTSLKLADLSILYPFSALSYIWVALMSVYWLKEVITLTRLLVMALIASGVLVIILRAGSKANSEEVSV